jgi:hypothetical protein
MKFATIARAIVLVSSLGGTMLACGGETSDVSQTATPEQVASLRERWNTSARAVHARLPESTLDFTWTPTAFPAPTFRGGSEAAYEEFAQILIHFYSTGDNLAFAKANGLLTRPFSDGVAGARDTPYTLQDMTALLTAPDGLSSLVRPETVEKLKTFCPSVGCDPASH